MSVILRERLESIANDMQPPVLPDDLWLRGRRLRRRVRMIAAGCAMMIILLAGVFAPGWPFVAPERERPAADASGTVPGRVYLPLWPFHARAQDAPPGPAALMYQTGSGRRGGVVVGRNGAFRYQSASGTDDVGSRARLSPDGRYLATDGAIIDLNNGRRIRFTGLRLVWSPDGTLLSTFGYSGRFALTNPATGVRREMEYGDSLIYAAFSPDGGRVVLLVSEKGTTPLAYSGYLVALNVSDGRVLWRVSTGETAARAEASTTLAGPAAWTPDGRIALLDYSRCPDPCDVRARLRFIDAQTGANLPGTPVELAGIGFPRLIAVRPREGLVVVINERSGDAKTHPLVVLVRPDDSRVTLLDPPREVTGIDIPRRSAETGQFGGPSSRPAPWPVDPALWFVVAAIVVVLTPWRRLMWRVVFRAPPPSSAKPRPSRRVR